jgi:hypothetical protein
MRHNVETIKANSLRLLEQVGAPLTQAHLLTLAAKYEKGYRRDRASKAPSTPEHLCGRLQTARAFYSLARHAETEK